MPYAKTLIDKASQVCGSDRALAAKMGIYPADITHLRQGKRALSPELAAEFADIAGEDARQAVIEAVIERNLSGKKGMLLKEILGKALAAGEAAVLGSSYKGGSISATETIAKSNSLNQQPIHRIYSTMRQVVAALRLALAPDHPTLARAF